MSYKGLTTETDEEECMNHYVFERTEDRHDHYDFVKKYLYLAEKNKVVMPYREFEKLRSAGGADEDPYDKHYRELIS